MNEIEKQIEDMQKEMIKILDDISVAIVNKDYKKALDIALQNKRELVVDCESQN